MREFLKLKGIAQARTHLLHLISLDVRVPIGVLSSQELNVFRLTSILAQHSDEDLRSFKNKYGI